LSEPLAPRQAGAVQHLAGGALGGEPGAGGEPTRAARAIASSKRTPVIRPSASNAVGVALAELPEQPGSVADQGAAQRRRQRAVDAQRLEAVLAGRSSG
jgi:hypothetical protein